MNVNEQHASGIRTLSAVTAAAVIILAAAGGAESIPAENFAVPEGFEVTIWATTPQFHNPTNMDVDDQGRIWVAEAVNYRLFMNKINVKH
jgi:hypothetical protein